MKTKILNYLSEIDLWLYLILTFCFFGCIRNFLVLKYTGLDYSYFITKVCVAMFAIYLAQILLILLRQRIVWFISLVQCGFCIFVYKDFTFLPLTNIVNLVKDFIFPNMTYGEEYFIGFAIVSFLFCLEMIKTYLLYTLTDQFNFGKKTKKLPKNI